MKIGAMQAESDRVLRKRATSYDVAKLAGVSQSAVSRVFQEGASASARMRERVLAAANTLGYRPNAIARGLITQRSNMVAVVISQQTNLYYPEVLLHLERHLSEQGIRVLLFTPEHEGGVDSMLEHILQYRVDGMVAAARLSPEQVATIHNAHIPLVFFNRSLEAAAVNSVCCDQEGGARWLVNELHAAGHERYAIIAGPEDSPVSDLRTASALRRLWELGVENVRVVRGDYGYASGRAAFAEIARHTSQVPDAVLAVNDVTAIGCIDEAREGFALKVPGDMSVVGFDGAGPAFYAAYHLSTVRQPVGRMSEAAVSILVARIEDPDLSPENRVFSGEPIRGESSRFALR